MRAEDGGSPPRVAVNKGTLTVNVIRNNNAPQWQDLPYATTISQQSSVNNPVLIVSATDSDQIFNVVRYEIIGDGSAPAYFQISNPLSGQITVASSLTTTPDLTFYVSISMTLLHRLLKKYVTIYLHVHADVNV